VLARGDGALSAGAWLSVPIVPRVVDRVRGRIAKDHIIRLLYDELGRSRVTVRERSIRGGEASAEWERC